MAVVQFPMAARYSDQARFNGYGYDPVTNTLVSYKRDLRGMRLEKRSNYNLNGWTVSHLDVEQYARKIAGQATAPGTASTFSAAIGAAAAIKSPQTGPQFPYVIYSKKNQASQYFFAGTTIAEAMERFAKRGEILDPAEVCVVNVDTGKIHKLVPTTIYKLV